MVSSERALQIVFRQTHFVAVEGLPTHKRPEWPGAQETCLRLLPTAALRHAYRPNQFL